MTRLPVLVAVGRGLPVLLVPFFVMRKWIWLVAMVPVIGLAQLRVATWNISNYGGGRVTDIQTVVFSSYQGLKMDPDILVTQEVLSASAQSAMLVALNGAPGSSGTWAAAPFTDGNDTDNAFFYRSDRLALVGATNLGPGGTSPLPPRETDRYDVRLLGYSVLQPKLAIYSCHMKAGTTPDDEARRLAEATRIRNNAASLTGMDGFMVVGDFNTYSSADDGFQKLIGSEANNVGRFFDPISTLGNWDGASSFRYVHTQDPATASGMNSRFDFLLLCQALVDGQGFDYRGNPNLPYSTLTWNDPAHSYRAWGNDGTSFGNPLTVTGNLMVGAVIAQAIKNAATTAGGHIPVFLDFNVPAETATSSSALNFGTAVVGSSATRSIDVWNSTDPAVWRAGVADLRYSLTTSSGFGAPTGAFTDPVAAGANSHSITMDTTTPGEYNGTLTVVPTSQGNPVTVSLTGRVVPNELYGNSYAVTQGTPVSGGLPQLSASDNQYAFVDVVFFSRSPVVAGTVEVEGVSPVGTVNSISVIAESGADFLVRQKLEAYNFVSGQWSVLDDRTLTRGDHMITPTLQNPSQYLDVATRKLKLRINIYPALAMPEGGKFTLRVDKVAWVIR